MNNNSNTFISYAWENQEVINWVKELATKLRGIGVDVKLDQWEVAPGDQLPHFMERSVRENNYVLIICTPKYKSKSENRIGGVGYEGDIMTAEVLQTSNHRKFIPILRSGTIETSIPAWLMGKYFIDLSSDSHFQNNFQDLVATLTNSRQPAPALGNRAVEATVNKSSIDVSAKKDLNTDEIRIKGIIIDEVTQPLNDGSKGSALYKIPFELNMRPSHEWMDFFIQAWNRPTQFTSMHRPGIASVYGNKIYLDGTTIDEIERYHKKTLKLAVEVANNNYKNLQSIKREREEEAKRRSDEHKRNIEDTSKRISFDD